MSDQDVPPNTLAILQSRIRRLAALNVVTLSLVGLFGFTSTSALATPIRFSLGTTNEVYGAGGGYVGTSVTFQGDSGKLNVPLDQFSVFEIPVGTLSITEADPLSRNLAIGFPTFDFPLLVQIGGARHSITNPLQLTVDQSNDDATLLGGRGTTRFDVRPNLYIDFQILTSTAGAANAGQTRSATVTGQFYGRPHAISVPEPSTFSLLGAGFLGICLTRLKRGERQGDGCRTCKLQIPWFTIANFLARVRRVVLVNRVAV